MEAYELMARIAERLHLGITIELVGREPSRNNRLGNYDYNYSMVYRCGTCEMRLGQYDYASGAQREAVIRWVRNNLADVTSNHARCHGERGYSEAAVEAVALDILREVGVA